MLTDLNCVVRHTRGTLTRLFRGLALVAAISAAAVASAAVAPDGSWGTLDRVPATRGAGKRVNVSLSKASKYVVNSTGFLRNLEAAPPEKTAGRGVRDGSAEIYVPTPSNSFERFKIVESSVMEKGLANQFPGIVTYLGQGVDDPNATIRCDWTEEGFHASVVSPKGNWYVDPYWDDETTVYASYFRKDLPAPEGWSCMNKDTAANPEIAEYLRSSPTITSGEHLRIYRLAMAVTGEFTQFHGGTVSKAQSAVVTIVNRINQVYENELSIRLVLVANNSALIYTDPNTDPFTNSSIFQIALGGEAQDAIDAVIGTQNYDVGHVLSTSPQGGVVKDLGIVCKAGLKASGASGLAPPFGLPRGDYYSVGYVCHELGHMFGASHTFNAAGPECSANVEPTTAYEPGSGTTIMSYGGICGGDNLEGLNADNQFHHASWEQIQGYVVISNGGGCAQQPLTGNHPPVVDAGPSYIIPCKTPFTLTASGSDPDGDNLTYSWEQHDLGPPRDLGDIDDGIGPLFRVFPPSSSPTASFPRLSDVIYHQLSPGETLAETDRTMNFRVLARDNHAGGGGAAEAQTQVQVVTNIQQTSSGPFLVLAPGLGDTFPANSPMPVAWDVSQTTGSPISCTAVNIKLSLDGGMTFPTTLASNFPNSGTANVTLPNVNTSTARVKVEAVGNIFYDMSHGDFTIGAGGDKRPNLIVSQPAGFASSLIVTSGTASGSDTPNLNTAMDLNLSFGVKNIGVSETGQRFTVRVYMDYDPAFGTETIRNEYVTSTIPANGEIVFRNLNIGRTTAGTHTLDVVVDDWDDVVESDETDNVFSRSFTVTDVPDPADTTTSAPSQLPRLVNLSARAYTMPGDGTVIGGFIIGGSQAKTVLIRGIGPSMVGSGVQNILANPAVGLFWNNQMISVSDNWPDQPNANDILVSGLAPENPYEAATLVTLAPGAYTVMLFGADGGSGNGLIEIYEFNPNESPRLMNLSTRAFVSTGEQILVGGMIVGGQGKRKVIIRGLGPSLAQFGVQNTLADPAIALYSGSTRLAFNDNANTDPSYQSMRLHKFTPSNARESGLVVSLDPGPYTVFLYGADGGTGIGLLEMYEWPY